MYRFIAVCCCALIGSFLGLAQNTPAPLPYVQIVITPSNADWNYTVGEMAELEIQAFRHGVPLQEFAFSYEIGDDEMPPEITGTEKVHNGLARIHVGTMTRPGFRQCVIKLLYDGAEYKNMVKLGFSVTEIKPTTHMPEDFTEYWQSVADESGRISLRPHVIPLPEYSTEKVEVSLVRLNGFLPGQFIYGYLCKPRREGKFPVLLNPPGAGVKRILPSTEYAEEGFLTLTIEVHGILPMLDENEYKFYRELQGNYMYQGLDNRDHMPFKAIFMACLRSVDYLCSLPEFDGINAGVTGGSQGGTLSMVTAALHPRITFLSAFYPAMCDMSGYHYGRAGGWPHLLRHGSVGDFSTENVLTTTAYYDMVNFAQLIRVTGFYSFGYNDPVCPPTSVYAAVNQVTSSKTIVVEPISGHWRFPETNRQSIHWMKAQCKSVKNNQ